MLSEPTLPTTRNSSKEEFPIQAVLKLHEIKDLTFIKDSFPLYTMGIKQPASKHRSPEERMISNRINPTTAKTGGLQSN